MIPYDKYLSDYKEELISLIEELCHIPAPSHNEGARAKFCLDYLHRVGASSAYIDDAQNVIFPMNADSPDGITVFLAHTDTVFPDLTPMPFSRDDKKLCCPGVGDDTACLAVMLTCIKYLVKHKYIPVFGIIFCADSCEEGLGNLKGIRSLMARYGDRVTAVYAFDGKYDAVVNKCVGSHRYSIKIKTEGGHSFADFGNKNAIYAMSQLVSALYSIEVPSIDDSITTYNVGTISGGTSINTIAQECEMKYEYRSDNDECLKTMHDRFTKAIDDVRESGIDITVDLIGERPCMSGVDPRHLNALTNHCTSVSTKHTGKPCIEASGSTDCNIPMSMGIPAVCAGTYDGHGEHTREEFIYIDSLFAGLNIALEIISDYFMCEFGVNDET